MHVVHQYIATLTESYQLIYLRSNIHAPTCTGNSCSILIDNLCPDARLLYMQYALLLPNCYCIASQLRDATSVHNPPGARRVAAGMNIYATCGMIVLAILKFFTWQVRYRHNKAYTAYTVVAF
jgi:hypothetical protein